MIEWDFVDKTQREVQRPRFSEPQEAREKGLVFQLMLHISERLLPINMIIMLGFDSGIPLFD